MRIRGRYRRRVDERQIIPVMLIGGPFAGPIPELICKGRLKDGLKVTRYQTKLSEKGVLMGVRYEYLYIKPFFYYAGESVEST